MNKGFKIIIFIIFLITAYTQAHCDVVHKTSFSGLTTWFVENKGIKIYYTDDSCGSFSKDVLKNVSDASIYGDFDWAHMQNPDFREHMLEQACKELTDRSTSTKDGLIAFDKRH